MQLTATLHPLLSQYHVREGAVADPFDQLETVSPFVSNIT
jgi:hypothetical protein